MGDGEVFTCKGEFSLLSLEGADGGDVEVFSGEFNISCKVGVDAAAGEFDVVIAVDLKVVVKRIRFVVDINRKDMGRWLVDERDRKGRNVTGELVGDCDLSFVDDEGAFSKSLV